jgi:hypothetical protein
MTQYTQGNEVRHTQYAPERLGITDVRQGEPHGCEQIGEDGLVGEAIHQGFQAVKDHGMAALSD